MKRRWLIIILILLTASCSGIGGIDPAPTETEAIAAIEPTTQVEPTAEASPEPTEAEAAPTFTVPPQPTFTETYFPANTQAPLPTAPQTILPNPPVIIAKVEGLQDWLFFLMGASQNGSWINAADVAEVFEEDTNFQLLTASDDGTWFSGRYLVHEHICDQYYVNTAPFSISESALGVAGNWPLRPRPVIEIPTKNEIYKTALATWLAEQSSSLPVPMISKIWRGDVEGNSTDEVFINASYFADPTGHNVEPGNYSVVLMRTVVGSEVATVKLAGDYYSKAAVNQFPLTYTLEFIADLNGDGRMEVVIGVSRWEGTGVMVYEIDLDQVQLVLSVICTL